jgi:PAS domain S-box-containing protein
MKILIVEDTEDSLIMLEMLIDSMGHEALCGTNGVEALCLAKKEHPDLIISDIMMPEMDGFELCRQIKSDPELQNTPFVFYSATYTESQDKDLAAALGAAHFIIKPQEPITFIAIIKDILKEIQEKPPKKELVTIDIPCQEKEPSDIQNMYLHSICKKLDKKINELNREKAALKKSEKKYRHLVELVQNYYFFYKRDTEGVFKYISPSVKILLGYKPIEFMVHYSRFLTNNPLNNKVGHYFEMSLGGEEQPPFEMEIMGKDGSLFWLEVKEFPKVDKEGKVTLIEGIAHNITVRKTISIAHKDLQEQLAHSQKMESVGRLAGGVAHDYNNMLAVILGFSSLALEKINSDHPLFDDLQEIQNAANHSADLTQQLLTFARKQTVIPKVLDLNRTIENILKILRRLIGENIDLEWIPCEDLWSIKMDSVQIDQILANLCANARDAIAGVGRISIETVNVVFDQEYCTAHQEFSPGEYVLLMLSDDGCGMDRKVQSKLFEPFFTTKGVGSGTGLGLSTVYGIVKQNNGFINVYSEPDQGTIFKIYLSRHVGEAESINKKKAVEEKVSIGNKTILLVEDELSILKLTKRMLESFGYIVLIASTPSEAIHLADIYSGEIHLLLSDVVLPEMNGLDLAKIILTYYSDLECLFMSGYSASVITQRELSTLDIHFIQKPFIKQDLIAKVQEALNSD